MAAGQQHPDGLGVLAEPPPGIIYTGLHSTGIELQAVNMAAGCLIAPHLPLSRETYKAEATAQDVAERIVNIARGSLHYTEWRLEDVDPKQCEVSAGPDIWQNLQCEVGELHGILLYEIPGSVTSDAPGHWVAIQRLPGIPGTSTDCFFRLDPIRGPFQLSTSEFVELLGRHRAWRTVRLSADVFAREWA